MMGMRLLRVLIATAMLPATAFAQSQATERSMRAGPLRLPVIFQSGMVLQREQPVRVWGWAPTGAAIVVSLNGRSARAVSDANGEWRAQLPPMAAGGPFVLEVAGAGTRTRIPEVLIGDVWIASGQSNMEWPLAQSTGGAAAVAAAHDTELREFAVPRSYADEPQQDVKGGAWLSAQPEHAGRFSAVAYFFARELRAATGVPIGIIHTSWGGSNIETWLSRPALGLSDSAWQAMVTAERARDQRIRDSLELRIGSLPSADSGLVDGRAVWADPGLDESAWSTIPVPGLWEQAGYNGLDGVAWYRTSFTLAESEVGADAQVSLGMIDDDDITWLNGIEIGRTTGYSRARSYTVPATALKPGRNVLAIRVVDGGGGGGPYGDPSQFFAQIGTEKRPLAGAWRFKVGVASFQADGQRINKVPSLLYNQMLHPLQRYPIKGVIWYQGESNANNDQQALAYRPLFATLIQSWRREWQNRDAKFPFLWVELPNFGRVDSVPPRSASWALVRESQSAALELPATAQVVTIDIGDPGDIHPRDKETVGRRLAQAALRVAYGRDVLASGPTYRAHSVHDGKVIIEFDHVGGGLVSASGESVSGFALAGPDGRWVWADAHIDGDRVIVSSADVPQPVAVRYAWSNSPRAALFNREGWPAAPFRTDRAEP